jgi:hypothetical protein
VPKGWLLVLCVALLAWRPLDFALELPMTIGSLGMRGIAGVVELLFHGTAAAVAVAAVRAIRGALPAWPVLARFALVLSALATVQSLNWSVLPHQTTPGAKFPLTILAIVHAAGWLVYLQYYARREAPSVQHQP